MMVVATRMSASWCMNVSITFSSSPSRHLSVADDDAGFRNQFLQLGGDFPDGLDAVVDEVDLAAAFEFLLDRGLD